MKTKPRAIRLDKSVSAKFGKKTGCTTSGAIREVIRRLASDPAFSNQVKAKAIQHNLQYSRAPVSRSKKSGVAPTRVSCRLRPDELKVLAAASKEWSCSHDLLLQAALQLLAGERAQRDDVGAVWGQRKPPIPAGAKSKLAISKTAFTQNLPKINDLAKQGKPISPVFLDASALATVIFTHSYQEAISPISESCERLLQRLAPFPDSIYMSAFQLARLVEALGELSAHQAIRWLFDFCALPCLHIVEIKEILINNQPDLPLETSALIAWEETLKNLNFSPPFDLVFALSPERFKSLYPNLDAQRFRCVPLTDVRGS